MYYQILIETKEKVGKSQRNRQYFELDKTDLQEVKDDYIKPYLSNSEFQFDGYFLNPKEIARVVVRQSENTAKQCSEHAQNSLSRNIIMIISPKDIVCDDKYTTDITKKVFEEAKKESKTDQPKKIINKKKDLDTSKVFIVHGHDDLAKTEAARFIEKLGLKAIILHEQVSSGKTIIEKIEEHSDVGFGIILYTPCDKGGKSGDEKNFKNRARQNVVFEHGYLIGKIGRKNVCALVKDEIETPNDISGVVYVPMDNYKAWYLAVAKEMRNSGYDIDMNLII